MTIHSVVKSLGAGKRIDNNYYRVYLISHVILNLYTYKLSYIE